MKKYIYPFLFLGSLLATNSCNLDRLPEDQISTEIYWKTEKDATLALNGVYSLLGSAAYAAWYNDAYADNAYAQYSWESTANIASLGDINATSDFGYDWATIRRANTFMENINKVSMDNERKKRYIAETRFLRAYSYFILAQIFGPLPLVEKSTPDLGSLTPLPEADIITYVLNELNAVTPDLPAEYGGGVGIEKGRVTKGAALALKARIQLYYNQWSNAAATAKQVMDSGTYSLFKTTAVTDRDLADGYESNLVTFGSNDEKMNFYRGLASYQKLFWAANKANREYILTSQYVLNSPISSALYTLLFPNNVGGWSSITPTIELVNTYWKRDGSVFVPPTPQQRAASYNDGNPTLEYLNEFKNRDTRLYASILFPKSKWNAIENNYIFNWPRGGNNTSKVGYHFRKLADPNYKIGPWTGPEDYPLIRYAEVLLTYAEAQNEVSGPNASVYDALDLIRDRVAMPKISRTQTQESLRALIRNERRIELAGEGFRYADVRRWNIGGDVMHDIYDITNGLVQKRVWQNKFVRFPYPQSAVDYNPLLKSAQAAKGY
ncbi:hypothetical protein IQ37_02460 [Chryseobacterium piperi]|uniref:Carbohydrate-binding protein SusD n=1 Tax=Chryseobacterium piperi TaxID=558152 RepID=A0A086BM80_9FLAO|nr:RagB/SusD family nutrient uptake outer membrane protein [Chryseobacterium piperi]ASW75406.1 RagB/SusD family nutrient uptake outer membrane protein [Chryseobacterium piperi]KFF30044.1 hypothetical protein IQ37_02460 [Chryseobacterium piperi]